MSWLALGGCAARSAGMVLTPQGKSMPRLETSSAGAVQHNLRIEPGASFHLLQVTSRQSPQRFRENDVVMFVLRGKLKLHLETHAFVLEVGDVAEVPRGTVHWAENLASGPSLAYLVATPPLAEQSRELVDAPAQAPNPWEWTMWGHGM